jgi:hypothetical protein
VPKSDPKNAPELRVVETPYTNLAHKLAGMLLWLAGEYRHPRQQAMIAEHMFASGFDLAAPVKRDRALYDLDELKLRLGKLDELVRDERRTEWANLYDEVDEIVELAKPTKGGGE